MPGRERTCHVVHGTHRLLTARHCVGIGTQASDDRLVRFPHPRAATAFQKYNNPKTCVISERPGRLLLNRPGLNVGLPRQRTTSCRPYSHELASFTACRTA